jgi:hypothetical protein
MFMRIACLALLTLPATLVVTAQEKQDPYGSIADVKLLKPEDAQNVSVTPAPAGAVVLFDGKSMDSWASKNGKDPARWQIVEGALRVGKGTGDIVTREKFAGKFKLHVEFRVPYEPSGKGQGRGNSGVYLQGRYEVQVLDSYGIPAENLQQGDCGGIYGVSKSRVNACKAPTIWQSYDITFQAPRCADGKVSEPGVMTVYQNGTLIQENVRLARKKGDQEEIVTNTTAGMGGDPCTPGPIMLQDHGHPVEYRNIWLLPIKE